MNLSNILAAIKNIQAHPKTSIVGAVLASVLALTSQPDLKHLVLAFAVALLGALAKDPNVK